VTIRGYLGLLRAFSDRRIDRCVEMIGELGAVLLPSHDQVSAVASNKLLSMLTPDENDAVL